MRPEYHLRTAEILANALDNRFNFLGIKFGLSVLFDAIPGIGDIIDALLSFYIVWIGFQLDLPQERISEMIANIIFNFVLGLIPIVGELTYLIRRTNLRNLAIIKQYLESRPRIMEGMVTG